MHVLSFVSLTGATLSVLVAAMLVLRAPENRPAARAFAGFLVCCALFVVDDAFYREDWFARWPWFYSVADPFVAAIGPCFFLYARAATEPRFAWRFTMWLHFLPAVGLLLLAIPVFFAPAEVKLRMAAHDHDGALAAEGGWVILLLDLYLIGYLGAAWWRLWRERERVAERQEEGRAHPLRGIGLFASLVLGIALFSAVMDFTPWARLGGSVSALASVLAVFAVLWTTTQPGSLVAPAMPATAAPAHLQPEPTLPASAIESPPLAGPPVDRADDTPRPETKRSSELNREDAERIAARVRKLLEMEKVFLDPDLSLHALAEQAKTTRHKLSAALRQVLGATFYQLIAGYRVREAAHVLETKAGAARTIADIAFASGFNTLSAFNAAFRAEFGVTPSVFRDQAQKKKTPGSTNAAGR